MTQEELVIESVKCSSRSGYFLPQEEVEAIRLNYAGMSHARLLAMAVGLMDDRSMLISENEKLALWCGNAKR